MAGSREQPDGRTGFRFDVERYRPGVPLVRRWRGMVSEAVRQAYDEVPPVVWLMVRRLFVTGVAGSAKQMRAQLRFKVQRDVAEDLISIYFAENAEELEREREAYLEQLHRAGLEEELAMGANPGLERYHRIASNMGVLLDAYVGEAMEGGLDVTPAALRILTSCLKDLQDSDPLVRLRGALSGTGGGKNSIASPQDGGGIGGEAAIEKALGNLRKVLERKPLGETARDRLAKYEERTQQDEENGGESNGA